MRLHDQKFSNGVSLILWLLVQGSVGASWCAWMNFDWDGDEAQASKPKPKACTRVKKPPKLQIQREKDTVSNVSHVKGCEERFSACPRCKFLQFQKCWRKDFDWLGELFEEGQHVGCTICCLAGLDSDWAKFQICRAGTAKSARNLQKEHFQRHQASKGHVNAAAALADSNPVDDTSSVTKTRRLALGLKATVLAPSLKEFDEVLQHVRKGRGLQQGLPNGMKRKKVRKMSYYLAESKRGKVDGNKFKLSDENENENDHENENENGARVDNKQTRAS